MATSISTSIIACLKAFNAFVAEVQDLEKNNPASLLIQAWQDELGRLRMWAANIGAHQTNQSSLDYRLRDSSHVRQQIKNLLDELLNRLHEAGKAISEDEPDDDDDIESLEDSSSEGGAPQTDVHRLHKSVATIVTCLFQMSMLVRKPAQHDLRIGSKAAEVAAFKPFDYNHVRDKYPQAEEFVVSRLGHANTRRRQYLKYRERHALKLKQGINSALADMDDNATSDLGLSETIATDVQNWNVRFDDIASQSGISQTSYAPTLMGGGDITIPTPPRHSRGGAPFECPYCYFIITVTSTRSWNRHVFDDLQPYVCLDKTCTTPHKLYTTRHEWAHHGTTMHHYEDSGESRKCILCGDPQGTAQQYDRHVARHLQELALFVLPQNNNEEPDHDEPCTESKSDSSIASSGPESSPEIFWRCCECKSTNHLSSSPIHCIQCAHNWCMTCKSWRAGEDGSPDYTHPPRARSLSLKRQYEERKEAMREREPRVYVERVALAEKEARMRAEREAQRRRDERNRERRYNEDLRARTQRRLDDQRRLQLEDADRQRRRWSQEEGELLAAAIVARRRREELDRRREAEAIVEAERRAAARRRREEEQAKCRYSRGLGRPC
ncbi:MAG: hypothetical protein Q9226_003195 [Calogaya cf. arnoldii]